MSWSKWLFGLPRRRNVPSALSRRLVRKLVAQGLDLPGGEDAYFIQRLQPGSSDRAAGAWVWSLDPAPNCGGVRTDIGSQWPASECVRGFVLETNRYGQTALIPRAFAGDDDRCTDCDDTGLAIQTERPCACQIDLEPTA